LARSSFSQALPGKALIRVPGGAVLSLWLALLLVCLISSRASADVGVVLNESLDTSVARITGSGHTAVYFSRICPASPVKLRLCQPGEQGSVISNYISLGEDQPFEWNIVPVNVYLYGVENPRYRPIVGSERIKHVLEERYRENYLSGYCASVRAENYGPTPLLPRCYCPCRKTNVPQRCSGSQDRAWPHRRFFLNPKSGNYVALRATP